MAAPHTGTAPNPGLVFDNLLAFQRTAVLRTAVELGVFAAIGEGAQDLASLAQRCSASERGMRILCDFLTVMGLLSKENGNYHHSPTSAAFLDPRSPACLASIATFLGNPEMTAPMAHLSDIVRAGHTTLPGEGSVEPDNPVWVEFAKSMAPMMAPMCAPLGQIVLEGLAGPLRVLDIAAGHGLFGIEVAKQHAHAHVVAVDWASVLEVAKDNAQKAGVADRYQALPGSAFDVDFGESYDIVLLTNFLHHFDPATCVGLLRKVRAALKPGGRVSALEFVPNEDRVSPPVPAMFSLTMLTTTPSGDAYTFHELEAMYREAGFERVTAHPVPTGPHTVVTGTNG
ncbi:MAG: class I SAM-dependent methyltransferase [Ignavibacteriota bacterium]